MKSHHSQNGGWSAAMKYAGIVMAIVYTMLGIFVLLRGQSLNIPTSYAIAFGAFLIVYGVFRGYRVYDKYFKTESHESD
jgi:hypothetical protein